MSNYDDAVKNLLKFTRLTEGIIALAPVLEELGSIDSALVDQRGRLEKGRAEEEAQKARIADLKDVADAAAKVVADKLAQGEADAAALVETAKAEAAKITNAARNAASAMIADGQAKVDAALVAVSDAQELLAATDAGLSTATQKRDSMNAEIEAMRARLGL